MMTVGQILRKTRLEGKIDLKDVANATKIRPEYILALERDDFQILPSMTFARGLLKNYAEFLGLSSKSLLAIFRRDFIQGKKVEIVPKSVAEPLWRGIIHWNPKLTLTAVATVFLLGLLVYLGYQYFSLVSNPPLEIIFPRDGEQITEEKIEVVGETNPDGIVTVNTNPTLVSSSGEFHYQLDLFPGENKIVIEVKNKAGRQTRSEISVFRLDK